jgi:hypothetical protein
MQKNDCPDQTSTSTGGCTKKGYQRLQVEAYEGALDRPLATTGEKGDMEESGIYIRLGPTHVDDEKKTLGLTPCLTPLVGSNTNLSSLN